MSDFTGFALGQWWPNDVARRGDGSATSTVEPTPDPSVPAAAADTPHYQNHTWPCPNCLTEHFEPFCPGCGRNLYVALPLRNSTAAGAAEPGKPWPRRQGGLSYR